MFFYPPCVRQDLSHFIEKISVAAPDIDIAWIGRNCLCNRYSPQYVYLTVCEIRTPKKREDVARVVERWIAILKLPVGSIGIVQLMNCEGHKLVVFLILIFLMCCRSYLINL